MDNLLILGSFDPSKTKNVKIASFDLDSTLIKTKSGNIFAKNSNDWVWLYSSIPDQLKDLSQDHQIIIFTNQKGLNSILKINAFKEKFNSIFQDIEHIKLYAALKNDTFRKPLIGMWENLNQKIDIDNENSFYVGDAAGREKDFSNSDYKFSLNIPLKFHTPEAFFLGDIYSLSVEPTKLDFKGITQESIKPLSDKELIILVGMQASGKSTFCKNYLSDYFRINQDTLKTKKKCFSICQMQMENEKKKIVIDNTNGQVETRKIYIDLAQKYDYKVRIFLFKTSREICNHMNVFREVSGERKRVPDIAYNMYKSKYTQPSLQEGYDTILEIKDININIKIDNDIHNKLFNMHLT